MAGYGVIYRAENNNDNETTAGIKKVEFGGTIPDDRSLIVHVSLKDRNRDTNISNPYGNVITRPWTGIEGSTLNLELYFDEQKGSAAGLQQLLSWYYAGDDTPVNFEKGRFGFRYDPRPEMNCRPTPSAGYKILDFSFEQRAGLKLYTLATLVLAFGGDYTRRTPS